MKIAVPAERRFAAGRYVVRRTLPGGGQKTVYVIHDTALDRECALALIKTDSLEPEELERLRREAQAMARLDHANIVAVYDIGEEAGRPFFVCQYIAGGDLRGELRAAGGALPIGRALAIAEDVCRALAHAHEHGIIHRDVKPANIWLTGEGAAKLGDFGLATAAGHSRLTLAGTVVGTAAYIAPEQALGQPADARSDLYALGCVLYELVTGRPPFLGDDALAVISQHVNTPPVAPSWHNPEVSKPLEALSLRLLAKSPDERPASAQEVAQELRRIIELSTAEPPPSPQPQAVADLRGLNWGRFVGRREEMEQLKDALDGALSGRAALIFIAGEPGIGKTRLAEEFAVYAGLRGAQVLSGRGYEGGSSLPYTPFIEALRHYTRSRPDDELRTQLGPGAPEIATLVSEIRARFPDLEEAPRLDPEEERTRLFESVTEFLHNASTACPIVLHLDDLHWADKPSLLLLQHLAQRTERDRLLILGAYRDVELDRTHPLSDALGALRRLPNYRRLLLRGLPQESVSDLLAAIDPSEEGAAGRQALAAALYRETEGNPFFIREVIAHLIETGKIVREDGRWAGKVTSISELGIPEGVREVIGRRLSRLSDGCNRMLTLASTMTGGFSWEALKAINADVLEAQLLDLLEEALAAQLLAERKGELAGTYDFTHALIRQTLYEELSTPRRVLLHRQIGEALEKLYAANVEAHLNELAHHFYQSAPGGDVEKAIEYARRAGDRAMSLVAWEEAAGHYERALQTLELLPVRDERRQADLLLGLGEALSGAGDREGYREAFARAAGVARRSGDSTTFANAALGFASVFNTGGIVDPQVVGLLEEALDLLVRGDSALRAMVTARLAHGLLYGHEHERRAALAQEALAMARRVGDKAALRDTLVRFVVLAVNNPYSSQAQLTDLIDEAMRLAEETGDKRAALNLPRARVGVALRLGDRDAVDAAVELEERLSRELRMLGLAPHMRAMQARLDGRLDAVEALAQRALEDSQRGFPVDGQLLFGAQMLDLRRAQGRIGELEGSIQGLAAQSPSIPVYRAILALVYQAQDRREEARAVFDELAVDGFAALPDDATQPLSLVQLAEVCSYLDDVPSAAVLYEKLLPLAEYCVAWGVASGTAGSASAPLGALATTLRRFDDAERHFEDALAMNRKLRAPTWVAVTQLGYARMLLRRDGPGDRERALEFLELALDAGQRMGMKKLVDDCLALSTTASH